jgi:hypothetical protein
MHKLALHLIHNAATLGCKVGKRSGPVRMLNQCQYLDDKKNGAVAQRQHILVQTLF